MKKDIDIEEFNRLVEQIKTENPSLDIELCKYIAGSYLYNDKKNIEKCSDDLEANKEITERIQIEA